MWLTVVNLADRGQSGWPWTIWLTVVILVDRGQCGWPWSIWLTVVNLVDRGQSVWPWSIWLTVVNVVDHGQSGWPWSIWLTVVSLVDRGQCGWPWSVWLTVVNVVHHGQSGWPWSSPSLATWLCAGRTWHHDFTTSTTSVGRSPWSRFLLSSTTYPGELSALSDDDAEGHGDIMITRWLYCMECPQYSIRLKALGYLCTSCLLPAFDEA